MPIFVNRRQVIQALPAVLGLPSATRAAQPMPARRLLNTSTSGPQAWILLAKAGVPRDAEIVAFADDPGEAAVNYCVLKLMGFADVKLGGITTTAGRELHRSGTR